MLDRREVLKTTAALAAAGAVAGLPEAAAEGRGPRVSVRRAEERGHRDHGWLDARHTFSFASYDDPRWRGFRSLRVMNDDRILPGRGFPTHPHRDMEILTYVIDGALRHRDSMGNGSVIVPGEVQRMSAGSGIRHSEFNPSGRERVRLLQIWLVPDRLRLAPSYAQKAFPAAERKGGLRLVASPDGREGSITIHQDARLYATLLGDGQRVVHDAPAGRHRWLQVARGSVAVAGVLLAEGDGAWTSDPGPLAVQGKGPEAEVLLFDLA